MTIKTGALTREELQAVWAGATDKAYREPFVAAGDGFGLEVWSQLFEQLGRASTAIDVTTQAMFIRGFSGQTNPPAAGPAKARVTLTFARTGLVDRPLRLGAGLFVEEETTDWGQGGGVTVRTGRRFKLLEDVFFHPGEQGPFEVEAEAERPGYGYNNPFPGTLRVLSQPGAGFANNRATIGVVSSAVVLNGVPSRAFLLADNQPDMPIPDHAGQYVFLGAGDNSGTIARMLNFVAPNSAVTPAIGSQVDLERLVCIQAVPFTGDFIVGETVKLETAGPVLRAYATVVNQRDVNGKRRLAFVIQNDAGWVVNGSGLVVTGLQSGATATTETVLHSMQPTAEAPLGAVPGATWRVLDWVADWKLAITNVEKPTGGRSGMLDELGNERAIYRGAGEDDESYRRRVAEIADVVSPNAIRRALNRALGAYPWCFREVGSRLFRGFFFDGDSSVPSETPGRDVCDAYDYDTIQVTGVQTVSPPLFREAEPVVLETSADHSVIAEGLFGRIDAAEISLAAVLTMIRKKGAPPANATGYQVRGLRSGAVFTCEDVIENRAIEKRRFRMLLDYEQFRGFFLIGLPKISVGDFGTQYDVGTHNAYDAAPFQTFFDGYGYKAAEAYSRVQTSVEQIRAGGAGFDLYLEESGCQADEPDGQPLYLINPSTIPNCEGAWDSFQGVTLVSGDHVSAWKDQSGTNWDLVQGTDANRPILLPAIAGVRRRPVLSFDGTQWLEGIRKTFPSSWTLVFLGSPSVIDGAAPTTPPNVPNTVFGDDDAGSSSAFGFGADIFSPDIEYTIGGVANYAAQFPEVDVVRMYHVTHGSGDPNFGSSGLASYSTIMAFAAAGVNRIGAGNANTDGFKGNIYAAAVFSRRLTTKELRLLFFRWQYLYL